MPLGATGGSGLPSLIPPELLTKGPGDPTTVVFLLNMVTPDELADDLEYQGGHLSRSRTLLFLILYASPCQKFWRTSRRKCPSLVSCKSLSCRALASRVTMFLASAR